MGAGIGCSSGDSCQVTGSGTVTATIRWVYHDGDTTVAPNPPTQIAIVEFPKASCTAQANGSQYMMALSESEAASDGFGDTATVTYAATSITTDSSDGHYSLVDSTSGVVTKTATLSANVQVSVAEDTLATGYASPYFSYTVNIVSPHAHPTNFRKVSYQILPRAELYF